MDELADFGAWLQADDAPVGEGLLRLSAELAADPTIVQAGLRALDALAEGVAERTPIGLVETLFGNDGFCGDVDDYHAEENSLLDQVIRRRIGMPITLSAVVIAVGRRIGIPLTMVGMPGHVIVGTEEPNRFIDAFGGVEVDADGLQRRLQSIFGPNAPDASSSLQTLDSVGAVNRVCNNLMRTWVDDRTGKLDRLLDIRAAIPGSTADRKLLYEVATGRGRFDIAARVLEESDPDDPRIAALWARLN